VPRPILCLLVLVIFGGDSRADGTVPPAETLVKLSIAPAPAPNPALRYLLLPELRELHPGNPIQDYMKCMMEQENFFFDKEAFDRREKLLAMPLKELPAHGFDEYGRSVLSQVDRAARLDNPDWEILLKMRRDGFRTLLPEVQQIRGLARAVNVRFRAEVALGHFDDAIRTAKTMFAIAQHVGEHPCFIAELVGFAIANQAIKPLEEMLEQPGCPNLFWAFTMLPRPFIRVEKGIEGERMMLHSLFQDLLENAPMTADQIKRLIEPLDQVIADTKPNERRTRAWLDERNKDNAKLSDARRRLIASGLAEESLRAFPADQVLLLDLKREMVAAFDDHTKIMTLSTWQREALLARIELPKETPLFGNALPFAKTVCRAQGRLDQRIALLQVAHALRLHAAEHSGNLPAKLSEIALPLPDDPFTGKPFRYEVNGATAHLRGTPPSGQEKNAEYNIHYALTLQN
jgi:hypothetical protein